MQHVSPTQKSIFWQQELAIMKIFLRPCQAKIFLVSKDAEFSKQPFKLKYRKPPETTSLKKHFSEKKSILKFRY